MPLFVLIAGVIGAALGVAGAVNAALVSWLPSFARGPLVVWTVTLLIVSTTLAVWWTLRVKRRR